MKFDFHKLAASAALLAMFSTTRIAAQTASRECHHTGHHRYKLIDLGTLGGPNSNQVGPGPTLNSRGEVIAIADLATPDPYSPNCFQDCYLSHAIEWKHGAVHDLGSLPGENNTYAFWLNDRGAIAGISENGLIDPLTNFPELEAVVWDPGGHIFRLNGLDGNGSLAASINNRGLIVGSALNTTADPFASFLYTLPAGTQVRAVLWDHGIPQDLGTLGGNDAAASAVNDRGQIDGLSYTNSTANATTKLPTVHPFFWENGHMTDIGSLGGTLSLLGSPLINHLGQVIGYSTLAGDQVQHAFLWEHGVIKDLGTLGGANSQAFYVTETGLVVGRADFSMSSPNHHAFLWKDGAMRDLGTLGIWPCSTAYVANSRGQVVGDTGPCGQAGGPPFLSEHGEHIVDLNSLLLPDSPMILRSASYINERGEITGMVNTPEGGTHAMILIPCDREHADFKGCERHVDEVVTDDMLSMMQTSPSYLQSVTQGTNQERVIPERFRVPRLP